MNQYVTDVLDVATDPDLAGSEAERLRERLSIAGLLAETTPHKKKRGPSREALARARREAGQGKPLSDFVVEGR